MTENTKRLVEMIKAVGHDNRRAKTLTRFDRDTKRAERLAAERPTEWTKKKAEEARAARDSYAATTGWQLPTGPDKKYLATLLYVARAHCRGRIHMRWWKKREELNRKEILTLDNQRVWLESRLTEMESREKSSKWYTAPLDATTRTLIRELINAPKPQRAEAA